MNKFKEWDSVNPYESLNIVFKEGLNSEQLSYLENQRKTAFEAGRSGAEDEIQELRAELAKYTRGYDDWSFIYHQGVNAEHEATLTAINNIFKTLTAPKSIGSDHGRHHNAGLQRACNEIIKAINQNYDDKLEDK